MDVLRAWLEVEETKYIVSPASRDTRIESLFATIGFASRNGVLDAIFCGSKFDIQQNFKVLQSLEWYNCNTINGQLQDSRGSSDWRIEKSDLQEAIAYAVIPGEEGDQGVPLSIRNSEAELETLSVFVKQNGEVQVSQDLLGARKVVVQSLVTYPEVAFLKGGSIGTITIHYVAYQESKIVYGLIPGCKVGYQANKDFLKLDIQGDAEPMLTLVTGVDRPAPIKAEFKTFKQKSAKKNWIKLEKLDGKPFIATKPSVFEAMEIKPYLEAIDMELVDQVVWPPNEINTKTGKTILDYVFESCFYLIETINSKLKNSLPLEELSDLTKYEFFVATKHPGDQGKSSSPGLSKIRQLMGYTLDLEAAEKPGKSSDKTIFTTGDPYAATVAQVCMSFPESGTKLLEIFDSEFLSDVVKEAANISKESQKESKTNSGKDESLIERVPTSEDRDIFIKYREKIISELQKAKIGLPEDF